MSERVLSDATESSESECNSSESENARQMDKTQIEKLGNRVKWALRGFIYKHYIGDCLDNNEVMCKRLLNHYNALD
jgi:hypothetical protein